MIYEGACHCGANSYAYATERPPAEWSVRACQCSFCRAHGATTTSDPGGSLRFTSARSDALLRYQFGQRTADFLICRRCGTYLGAVISTTDKSYGIVNLNTLVDLLDDLPEPDASYYDAESPHERVARRESRWTPIVDSA